MQTSNSGANRAVLYLQNDRRGQGPIDTCDSGPKVALLHTKNTDDGGEQKRLVFLMLSTLLYMHKTTGHVWDP